MALRLYNSLRKQEEVFEPLQPGRAKMYTCGPTVYGRPHIGNYSSFLMADLLRRWLEVSGYTVEHVKNITDVGHLLADRDEGGDKVEEQAKREHLHPLEIARKYEGQFLEDERDLRILEPLARPRATETIREMVDLIQELKERGFAYETEDGVYFSIAAFPRYGQLSGNTIEGLSAGARITVNERKKHPADFALWKKCVGENASHVLRWLSPWGEGFPGWHIECSAMSMKYLGPQLDLHTGGEDNIFPHHECEIAQSEAATGLPFVRIWVHKRHFSVEGQKMSKSLGNIFTLSDVVARGFHPLDLRFLLLSVHYRAHMNFTWKGMEEAQVVRQRITQWMGEVRSSHAPGIPNSAEGERRGTLDAASRGALEAKLRDQFDAFTAAMDDDLNTSKALAALHDLMALERSARGPSSALLAAEFFAFVGRVCRTFGCFEEDVLILSEQLQALVAEREQARQRRDFTHSDCLRREAFEMGFLLEDLPGGAMRVTRRRS